MKPKVTTNHPRNRNGILLSNFRKAGLDAEFRVVDEDERTAWIRVCVYNVIDDYGTIWLPGCWTEWLNRKKPKGAWSHDWSDVIGQAIDFRDSAEALDLLVKFSEFDAVPRAKQAWTQLRDGDVDEFSFGFDRLEWIEIGPEDDLYKEGAREKMVKSRMYEWSPVLVGAVPGTKTLSVRTINAEGTVDKKHAADVLTKLAAGDIDLADALAEIKNASSSESESETDDSSESDETDNEGSEEGTESTESDDQEGEQDLGISDEALAQIEAEALDAEVIAAQAGL